VIDVGLGFTPTKLRQSGQDLRYVVVVGKPVIHRIFYVYILRKLSLLGFVQKPMTHFYLFVAYMNGAGRTTPRLIVLRQMLFIHQKDHYDYTH
jgi:hypothetical protein